MKTGVALFLFALSTGLAVARADSRVEKTLKLEPGGHFFLDTDDGAVVLSGSSGSSAHVVFTSPRSDLEDRLALKFESGEHSVTVTARNRHHGVFFHNWNGRVRVQIEVPFETAVELRTAGGAIEVSNLRSGAKLRTSGGAVTVNSLNGDLDAETSGGGIHLTEIRGTSRVRTSGGGIDAAGIQGSLDAGTSGGSVEIRNIGGDLRAHSSGGPIRISDARGTVNADTSGGGIHASFARGNSKGGRLESSGGGITVEIDPASKLTIDAEGEHVDSDLPIEIRGSVSHGELHGRLNGGGASLRLETSGGSIRIRSI